MGKIHILDESVANMIAAGEVVERPASVVKELVENSLDAGASAITVEIKNGGIASIRVSDNGSGIEPDDVGVAFIRHATSKIRVQQDLEAIHTLGFRGEALCSIAAVSKVLLTTKTVEMPNALQVVVEGGEPLDVLETGAPQGTTIEVRDIFYNTPARMKFLKKDTTEAGYISDLVQNFALAHPEVSFRLINNGRQVMFSPGDGSLRSAIYTVYGRDYVDNIIEISYGDNSLRAEGYIGTGSLGRPNRNAQSFFVNGRYIRSTTISAALDEAYKNQLMVGKFPFAVIHLTVNPAFLDVNVHPNKLQVKFSNERQVFDTVYWAAKNALYEKPRVPSMALERRRAYKMHTSDAPQSTQLPLSPAVYPTENSGRDMPSEAGEPDRSRQPLRSQDSTPAPSKPIPAKMPEALCQPKQSATIAAPVSTAPEKPEASAAFSQQHPTLREADTFTYAVENTKKAAAPQENREKTAERDRAADIVQPKQDYRIIGQIFLTYILLERGDELLLIDQHAAHERLRYEQLMQAAAGGTPPAQSLMTPVLVDLPAKEYALAMDNLSFFESLGIGLSDFGGNVVSIHTAPVDVAFEEVGELFRELLDQVMSYRHEARTQKQERALYTVACRSAIKANHALLMPEMEALVRDVFALGAINTCPHGRPILISLTRRELERQFGRIV